jgi:hypothetical protein
MKRINSRLSTFAAVVGIVGIALAPVAASAAVDDEDTIINAVLSATISLTTSGTVTLNIAPVAGGAQTTASDTVTVTTNQANGYNLNLKDFDATLTLANGGDNIAASTNNTWGSAAALANNTWGFAVASGTAGLTAASGFDASYSALTDQTSDSAVFMGIQATDELLRTTSAPAGSGEVTTVWYSAKADTTRPIGTYTNTVVYTATTNP